jgi:uncharacterized protein YggT (Ycf19 family)
MALIDLLLNIAGLLLWLNWRSTRFDPLVQSPPATTTLVGLLKRAEPRRFKGWHFPATLACLLFLRALLYWQIGAAVEWTPNLQLGGISVPFRSDFAGRMILFSFLSFGVTLAWFYLGLLFLSTVNGRAAEHEPLQKLVRLHLGAVDRWSWQTKLALPLVVIGLLWVGLSVGLAQLRMIPPPLSFTHRCEQALVIGLGAYLAWKYVIVAVLVLSLVTSYVYLGSHPFWNYVTLTGGNILRPLRWLPLRLGKADFAPILGIAIVFLGAELAQRGLELLYERLPF